jgi:GntR family transcriptional repressor for pyruvate dehydrogenase complex
MTSASNTIEHDTLFTTLHRESTMAYRVTSQIEGLMVERKLQPGDRLPSERELARQFGVSRTVVREAVRALVAKSLLEVRPGSGTIICSPSVRSVTQSMTMLLRAGNADLDYNKVHEVRRLLEIEIAGLAAERRSVDDLARLEALLAEMPQLQADHDRLARNDVNFHAALARATHNELFSLLLDSVVDTMLQVRKMGLDVPEAPAHGLLHHRAIFVAVEAGRPEQARQAMLEHIIDSETIMRKALALHAQQDGVDAL